MSQKLVISACNYLLPEIDQVIKNGDYPDVQLLGFSARCTNKFITSEKVSAMASKLKDPSSDFICLGSICLTPDREKIDDNRITKIKLDQCFELFINKETVSHYISKGYYVVSNGWLRTLKQHFNFWGLDKETAKSLFQESMKGILLLDTKISGDYLTNLKALSEYMGLPYHILPVGLSHCERYISSLVLNWRNENERQNLNKTLASSSKLSSDYSVIITQLEILVNLTDELKIIEVGFELLNILYAPQSINFIGINKKEKFFRSKHFLNYQLTDKDRCFKIEIFHSDESLGYFEIINVQFPQYISQYKEMAVLISQIFSLSIANARKYQITVEQKEKLERYSLELQKINQSKDKFFSIIAHDLKGPFNSLIRISDFLVESIQDKNKEDIDQGINLVRQVSSNTYRLLLNLLEWSQSQTGNITFEPERFVLSDLIDETTELKNHQAKEKNIKIHNFVSPLLKVNADKNMLKTVLRNLISNAIKYTRHNGKIAISASFQKNNTQISVADTGIGISKENVKKLFTLENSIGTLGTNKEEGTGLGLILSKEYIKQHKGRIWVESEVEKGSIFHFTLPNR